MRCCTVNLSDNMKTNRLNNILMVSAIILSGGVAACKPITVEAKGFSGGRSASVSRPAPKPAPRVVNRTTNNTTVIRQTKIIQAAPAQSAGSGIGGTILGSAVGSAIGSTAGTMLGNALSKPDEPAPQAQQVAPQQPVCDPRYFNCTPKTQ